MERFATEGGTVRGSPKKTIEETEIISRKKEEESIFCQES